MGKKPGVTFYRVTGCISHCSWFMLPNRSVTTSWTVSILSAMYAFAPQKRSPFSTSPLTASISLSVMQYGISAGEHLARQRWQGLWGIVSPLITRFIKGFIIARPGIPTGLFTMAISSAVARTRASYRRMSASQSLVVIKRVATWTPSTPRSRTRLTSSVEVIPPAATTGIWVLNFSA